ncbi:hypothetical protein U9M48_041448 [Paspalum notatum var. saurae]|uniref:Uncharacterized protein n=1 Tax=Paspalum notatum var. saurae TaxID=547442 RepID=A0AAQ3UQF7_PASNO
MDNWICILWAVLFDKVENPSTALCMESSYISGCVPAFLIFARMLRRCMDVLPRVGLLLVSDFTSAQNVTSRQMPAKL